MGEGGAISINDPELIERAEIIREKGTNRNKFFRGEIDKYTWVDYGSSYLPSELNCAYLYPQLKIAEKIRIQIIFIMKAQQRRLTHIKLQIVQQDMVTTFYLFRKTNYMNVNRKIKKVKNILYKFVH